MKHFSDQERYYIELYLKQGYTPYKISKLLGRSNPAVYYEIRKGSVETLDTHLRKTTKYYADVSIRKTLERSKNQGRSFALSEYPDVVSYIEALIINERYSCYAALQFCRVRFPDINISLSTLYNYINNKTLPNLRRKHLLYKYKAKKEDVEKRIRKKSPGTSIDVRPNCVNERSVFGHWEMDSVIGKKSVKGSLIVLTERLSRYELIFKVPAKTFDSTLSVINFLERKYKHDFYKYFKSITCDNGSEFMNQSLIQESVFDSNAQRTQVYYCHPFCSSERGSNENQNRIIRRFIPKSSDINNYNDVYIKYVQDYMNNLPRKMFKGRSSLQVASEYGFV